MSRAAALAAAGLFLLPLSALAEDAPITRADGTKAWEQTSRLGIELVWGVADRGSTVTLHMGVGEEGEGFLKVSEITTGNYVVSEGYAPLDPDAAAQLLNLSKAADFQSFPATVPDHPGNSTGPGGVEAIFICRSALTLSETRGAEKKTVQRGCPRDKADRASRYARALVHFAQGHFPDLARTMAWPQALQ